MEIYKGTPQMPPLPQETKPYWKPLKPYFLEEGVALGGGYPWISMKFVQFEKIKDSFQFQGCP